MKTKFTWIGIMAIFLGLIGILHTGCKEDDLNDVVQYYGKVVYINTTTAFPDLTVKVTDGRNTHCQTQTDAGGIFRLSVKVNEINGNYYLLAGDSTCIPKQVALGGYGQAEVDLGVIEVEGPALPTVVTNPVISVTAESAILGGKVETDGRLSVTARGICYSKDQHPVVEGLHTTEGTGKGEFTSNLKDLEHNTIYYARAYATNRMGTAYGEQVKFTTEEGVAVVITDSVIRITAHSAKCKGHVESDGGFAVTKRGTCWSKKPDPTIDDDCTDDGSGKGEFTSTLKDLTESTKYYVRTYATNSTSTSYGEQIIITTLDGLAVVQTDSITNITATSFTAYGFVVSDCDIPVTARGFCYATAQYPTIENAHTTIGKGLGKFQGNIINLNVGTTYYVRAYATNETETAYGEQIVVTTLDGLPIVTTGTTTATSTQISSGGTISNSGGYNITARGVCYSTTNSVPTIADQYTTSGIGTGAFSTIITSVNVSTTYYVRAYATNSIGTGYGDVVTVTTGNGLPIVKTTVIGENVTQNTATSGGQVTDDGGYTVTARGVCWNTLPYPTIADNKTTNGTGTGYYTSTVTGIDLTSSNTYYVRAYATNKNGTTYGEQVLVSKENWDYKNLPSVEYGGYIYRIYPDLGAMTWSQAKTACENLVYGGYDDWMLPETKDLLVHILTNCKTGWKTTAGYDFIPGRTYSSSARYWTSQKYYPNSSDTYYIVFYDYIVSAGTFSWPVTYSYEGASSSQRVRPVRKYKASE